MRIGPTDPHLLLQPPIPVCPLGLPLPRRMPPSLRARACTGSHVQPSVSAVSKHGCAPIPPQNTFLARAPRLRAPDCESGGEQQAALCAKLEQTAKDGEVALVLVSRANARALPQFAEATRLAGVSNVLLVAHDSSADGSFGSGSRGGVGAAAAAADAPSRAARDSALPWVSIESVLPAAALSALPPAALKYALLRQVLRAGVSALLLEPSVVLLTDPFRSLYRDSDVEAMAAGWDEPSAYGCACARRQACAAPAPLRPRVLAAPPPPSRCPEWPPGMRRLSCG